MRLKTCLLLLPLLSLLPFSFCQMLQGRDRELPPGLASSLIAIRDAALQNDYAYKQVAYLSDNIGPRPAGSAQAQAAVDYVAGEMRKLGLDVHLEEVMVRTWQRGTDLAELVAWRGQTPGTTQKIVVTALGGNAPTSDTGVTGDVVVVNNFAELRSLDRRSVEGRIVLFNFPMDKQKAENGFSGEAYGEAVAYRVAGAKAAEAMGAVAALVRSVGTADYRIPHTGYSIPTNIPAGAVSTEDALLIARLAAQGEVRLHLTLTSHTGPEVKSYNVVGDLKGSEHPEQIVVVSGHLDSWDLGTGALDDGAGVATAMETGEILQSLHLRPIRTLRIIAWMDEERDGRGHDAYAAAHRAEFGRYVAALESDSGAGHPLGFDATISAAAMDELEPVAAVLQPIGANILQTVPSSPEADVAPMSQEGVPVLGLLQDTRAYFHYHHTAADTLDKIDPKQLKECAAAIAVMGYAIAEMRDALPR